MCCEYMNWSIEFMTGSTGGICEGDYEVWGSKIAGSILTS
jgi:hypothetical protein